MADSKNNGSAFERLFRYPANAPLRERFAASAEPAQPAPAVSAPAVQVRPPAQATTRPAGVKTVRCAADKSGAWDGEYAVTGLKAPHFIFRDPESGRWYEARTGKHFADCWLGDTKKEAVERLMKRDGGR